jgi:glutaminyl-tRNA synthetase
MSEIIKSTANTDEEKASVNFIDEAIIKDLDEGVYNRVQTRFPPEPNGYLHIGHAKAICIDFGAAEKYNGKCNLRFDDTNPTKEDVEYVDSIMEDIKWLGFEWDNVYFASDYFEFIHECAIKLIEKGKAYVDESSADVIREERGTLTEPGKESKYRNRPVEESLDLFKRMTAGEFETGSMVLRAKIDMSSGNLNMRDPIIYRVLHATHHRTGDKWCVYPMYDFAHPLSDAKEGVTHSLCTLEFEDHRPLYDWFLKELDFEMPPRQIEFARLNLNYSLTSKRRCIKLVDDNIVSGWDDPRMSTICGMRRRGFPPEAIRDFCDRIGVSKAFSVVDMSLLEYCVRDYLNKNAPRAMAVLNPLKVIIDNYEEGKEEDIFVDVHPEKPELGKRKATFTKELYIEKTDYCDEPPKGYYRFSIGKEVRLKGAYYLTCNSVDRDENGEVVALHCSYDPETKGGSSPDGRKVRGTIQWVSATKAIPATAVIYDRLFNVENPSDESKGDFKENLNPNSMEVKENVLIEDGLSDIKIGDKFQFMRHGYFCLDRFEDGKPVFNRTVALKDSFSKK